LLLAIALSFVSPAAALWAFALNFAAPVMRVWFGRRVLPDRAGATGLTDYR